MKNEQQSFLSEEERAQQKTHKRLPRQSAFMKPAKAKPMDAANPIGNMRSVVPVSTVAKDWGISARRVRSMLAEGRLEGRQLDNGYWEVIYPYCYVFGTRGPQIKRQQNLPPPTCKRSPQTEEEFLGW
jgi:hypothetical protein